MKKLILFVIAASMWVVAIAQNGQQMLSVKGITIDSATNKPVGYVTVALQNAKTHTAVKTTLTNSDGSFVITGKPGNRYQLVLAFIGYQTKTIPLADTAGNIDAGKIVLTPSTNQLKEVSISAVKPVIKQEVDRLSYNVQNDPENTSLSTLDMMRKVPLLSVDGSDNILLKGNGNYKILINGKESAMFAQNPSDILKAMPASNIERIEVITTPPAKYDAEGLAGIINIITKRNAGQGFIIGGNTRYNSFTGPGYGLNSTFRTGKFGISVYGNFANQKPTMFNTTATENVFADQNLTIQRSADIVQTKPHSASAELSYEIDSLNLLTGSVNVSGYHSVVGINQLSNTDSLGTLKQAYSLQNHGIEDISTVDAALNYQLGFRKSKERLLTFSYQYSYSPIQTSANNLFTGRVNYSLTGFPDYQQYNNASTKTHTIQVDYAGPLSKQFTMEAGGKAILRNNFSDYHAIDRDSTTQQYLLNAGQTNDFNYKQDVYSVYTSYALKLAKWTMKGGLRLEHTSVNADFVSSETFTANDYNNLIPSVAIQYAFSNNNLNFGFTQRIQRPGISQLNPYVDRANPLFVFTGNPGLRPELDNTFELNYSRYAKNYLNIGLSYAFSTNSIQNVSNLQADQINNKSDTVIYNTYQNLGSNATLGFNIYSQLHVSKKLTFSISGLVNYIWLKGAFDGQLYRNSGFTGYLFASGRYQFGNGYAFGINSSYSSGRVTLQGESSDYIFSQFLLSKDFLSKKITLSLSANNPFSRYTTFTTTTNSADFHRTLNAQLTYRTFMISANFRFGKLKKTIKKAEHAINNDDLKPNDKNTAGN